MADAGAGDMNGGGARTESSLERAEKDATENFWFEGAGDSVVLCGGSPPPAVVSQDKTHWIEISMVDQEGNPVAGEAYRVTVPGGAVITGTLNSRGRARINGIDPGTAKVTFPNLDKDVWRPR
jgi:uncharacterized protein (DUF2345 family)